MASAEIVVRDETPDRGPDLLQAVKLVKLRITANEAKALLLVLMNVGGDPDKTLRGETDAIGSAIFKALGVNDDYRLIHRSKKAQRFLNREDLLHGTVAFTKGGGHF